MLVITAVNLANLLIARGVARQREMAIRLSVAARACSSAASRREPDAGGVRGSASIRSCLHGYAAAAASLENGFERFSLMAHPDWQAFAFAAIVSIVTGLAFGLLPALQSTRAELSSVLKTESGASPPAAPSGSGRSW